MRRRRAARARNGGRVLAGLAAPRRCAGAERSAFRRLPNGCGAARSRPTWSRCWSCADAAARWRCVVTLAVAIQLVPLAGPLLLSRDAYAYWDYGRLAAQHDANPYAVPPARFPDDPATRQMAPAWRTTMSVYGPVFTGASAGLARTSGRAGVAAFEFRLAAAAGMLALVAVAAVAAPLPAFAAAFVGWNPLLAIDFAGGGHNDVWMMVLVLAALALVARHPRVSGSGWALAAGVKWVALALLPLSLLRSSGREARASAIGFLVAAAAIAGGRLPRVRDVVADDDRPGRAATRRVGAPVTARRARPAGVASAPPACARGTLARAQREGGSRTARPDVVAAARGDAVAAALVRRLGRAARGGRGGRPGLGAHARPLRLPAPRPGADLMLREVAEYPNCFGPLGPGSERIETPRYTLCLGPGSTWNTVQRQRFPLDELDEVLEEVRAHLRERGRTQTQWEVGSSAPPGLVDALLAPRRATRHGPLRGCARADGGAAGDAAGVHRAPGRDDRGARGRLRGPVGGVRLLTGGDRRGAEPRCPRSSARRTTCGTRSGSTARSSAPARRRRPSTACCSTAARRPNAPAAEAPIER